MKRQKRKQRRKSRRAHLCKLRLLVRSCGGQLKDKKAGGLRGAGGSAPSTAIWWRGGLTAPKHPLRKSGACAGFSSFTAPRLRGLCVSPCPSRRGRVFGHGAGAFVASLFPPTGGDAEGGGGAPLPPAGCLPPSPGGRRGKGGGASAPDWTQKGPDRGRRRPRYRLDKTLIFQIECISNYFNMLYIKSTF